MDCYLGFKIIIIVLCILYIFKKNEINEKIIPKLPNIIKTKHNYNYDKLGDTYFYGSYEIGPDYTKAIENYNKVLIYDPDNENIPQIRRNLNELTKTNEFDVNRIFIDDIDFAIQNDVNDFIININFDDNLPLIDPPNNNLFNFDNLFDNNNENREYYNDFQNVHDSTVTKTVDSSIKKLEDYTNKKNNLTNINKFILNSLHVSSLSDADKTKVRRTIEYIDKNSNSAVRDRKLKDNLILIGNRIQQETDKEQKNIMLDNLHQELKDCIQPDGNMYCNTGIANRIVNSLNGIEKNVNITPKWALKEEMMRSCGKIRDKLEKTMSTDDADFDDKLKEKIKKELKKDYVIDNKILKEEDFNREIAEWIDYI